MVETPVLYITFARPEYACQSFAAIKKARPKKLYFYSNKARSDKPDEVQRNEEVRSYINQIDWECNVKTWFRDEYVDVYTSLWGAIDWVFNNEEKAIIIEEDVVASLAFFDFVDQIIDEYKDNDRVWMISGNNAAPQYSPKGMSFFASRTQDIYGWASWRRVWRLLDRKMYKWPEYDKSGLLKKYWGATIIAWYKKRAYNKVFYNHEEFNPWDYVFSYNKALNNAYTLMPARNLAIDIGLQGIHHSNRTKTPLSTFSQDVNSYVIDKKNIDITPTSYDYKHFYFVKLRNMIWSMIKNKI